ncbi:MAG: TerB family tellurite resistance protein [Deltaproteobacteria bacterium]|nr:TerB family tellurite resistance protein [Deltaproteobacteria bacterium]MBW2659489.1 TerB family tellurite resistance protein [Deltaproteobacteria bacterium]
MFKMIKKILGTPAETGNKNGTDIREAHIALCVLLLETAHADGECSENEKEHIISTMTAKYNVQQEEIDKLITSADEKRRESVDLFSFTRYMNNNFSHDERLAVMDAVWRIIHIDDRLEAHEDHLAHKLANLLRLTHKELIDSKLRARQQLANEQ